MNDDDFIREFNTLVIDSMKNKDIVDPITTINDNLFLGQGRTTLYGGMLWKLGITHIVSISRTPHGSVRNGPFQIFEIFDAPDIIQTDLAKHFTSIFDFIKNSLEQNGKVYIHCEMGCSRAPMVVIGFIRSSGQFDSLQQCI